MMRGIEWAAIPMLIEIFGVEDADGFVFGLVQIREHMRSNEEKNKEPD